MRQLTEKDFETMGLPRRYCESNWQSMKDHGLSDYFIRYINNIRLAAKDGIGLFIGGVPFSGKSYSASFIAKIFRRLEYSVQWLDSIEAYNLLVWNKEHNDQEYGTWLNRVQTVDVLILDNFGMEKGSNKQKILVDVLKKRNESKLLTIITTRMTLKQLSDLYEESMDFLRYTMKDVSLAKSIKSDRNHIEKY